MDILGRYVSIFFKDKKSNVEIFKDNLGDDRFSSFFIENLKKGSRIVIGTKTGYTPFVDGIKDGIKIESRTKKIASSVHNRNIMPIPDNLTASPFYLSRNIFVKNKQNKAFAYDENLFFTGIRTFSGKNYNLAKDFFKEIVLKHKDSEFYLSSYFLLGDCYKNLKQYDDALKIYNEAIKLSDKNDTVAQTLFSMADIYKIKNYYSKVRRIYSEISTDYNGTKWGDKAQFLLAKTYYDIKKYKKAIELFLNIRKSSAYYAQSMLFVAESFIKQGNDAKAILAYYTVSDKLDEMDVAQNYKEMSDVALSLCKFKDNKESERIFDYIEQNSTEDMLEYAYLNRMQCDIENKNYKDLRIKADYIIKNSKIMKNIKAAKKMLDEEKLMKGDVKKDTIDKILSRYRNDPKMIALALFVYAKENFRNRKYKVCLDYVLKIKKLYPKSKYNQKAKKMSEESLKNLIDDLYSNPDKEKLEYIYSMSTSLKAFDIDMCRLSLALIAFNEIDRVLKVSVYIKDEGCKKFALAKYNIEKGKDKKAMDLINDMPSGKNYDYYTDIIFGDINYFNSKYSKALDFYKKAYGIKYDIMKDYIMLKTAQAYFALFRYKDVIDSLNRIKTKIYLNESFYLKGVSLYNEKKYKQAVEILSNLLNNLDYKERALFYISLSYIGLGDKKSANEYFDKLKKLYPKSVYIKQLQVLF